MDLDVFGSTESKVVIIGEDNVVIVTNTRELHVHEEETLAIAELKIEPAEITETALSIVTISSTEDLSSSIIELDHPQVELIAFDSFEAYSEVLFYIKLRTQKKEIPLMKRFPQNQSKLRVPGQRSEKPRRTRILTTMTMALKERLEAADQKLSTTMKLIPNVRFQRPLKMTRFQRPPK